MSFKDRIVLVTGGVQGIGRAIGETFARDGAKLCIADVQETAGQAAANEIAALGGEAMFVKIDVTSTASVEAAVQQCYRVSPGPDFMLVVHVTDMAAYLALAQRLFTSDANVRNVKAFFSLHRAKFKPQVLLAS